MKKNKKQYETGGQLGLQDITKMMGMFGPVGSAIGTGMNILDTLTAPKPIPQATAYKNTNAFGYATGGQVDPGKRNRFGYTEEQINQALRMKRVYEDSGSPSINYLGPDERSYYDRESNGLYLARPEEALGELAHAYQRNALQSMNDKKYANSNAIPLNNASNQFNPDFLHNAEFTARKRDQDFVNNRFRQSKEGKQSSLNFLNDHLLNDKITDSHLYFTPGTIEYNAHQEIEPSMKKYITKGFATGGSIGPGDPKKKLKPINASELWKHKGKLLDIADIGADITDAIGIAGGVGAAPFNNIFGPLQASRSLKNGKPLKAMFDMVPMNSLWMPSFMENAIASDEANNGIINAAKSIPNAAGVFRNQVKQKFGFAYGGDLNQIGNGAYQVDANNPNQTDSVNLGSINVDHNEVIDNNKVISDKFFNPLTGKKIVDEYAKLTKSQKNASERSKTHNDPIAQRTHELMEGRKNDLFKLQEMIATMNGNRNADGSTVQQQQYATGGMFPQGLLNIGNSIMNSPYMGQGPNQSMPGTGYETMPLPGLGKAIFGSTSNGYNDGQLYRRNYGNEQELPGITSGFSPQQNGILPTSMIQRGNPDLNASLDNRFTDSAESNSGSFWDQFTTGDKVGMGVTALSMIPKAISAFSKVQKEPYRTIDAPITMQQMDPTNALYNSDREYRSQLYNVNNQTNTINNANALRANAYAGKLNADNSILSNFENQNKSLVTQYQDRLANRQASNNQSMTQTDDLNSRNEATQRNRQMGFYNDIAGAGQTLGNTLNQRERDNIALGSIKQMAPDVYQGYMDQLPYMKWLKEQTMSTKKSK